MQLQLAPLTLQGFAGKTWQRYPHYGFAAQTHLVPVVLGELAKATTSLPLAFVAQGEGFELVAVMSLKPDANVMIAPNGRWMGPYVPAALRGYPFVMARPPEAKAPVLCLDLASGLLKDDGSGEAFFDAQGKLAAPVEQILNFLSFVERSREQTRAAVAALAQAGLIKPWSLSLEQKDGKRSAVQGLFNIDEAALGALDDAAWLGLRSSHALALAYAQLYAGNLMETLAQLTQARAAPQPGAAGAPIDPAALMAMGIATDDGLLKFD